jgi:hypothetical protein
VSIVKVVYKIGTQEDQVIMVSILGHQHPLLAFKVRVGVMLLSVYNPLTD